MLNLFSNQFVHLPTSNEGKQRLIMQRAKRNQKLRPPSLFPAAIQQVSLPHYHVVVVTGEKQSSQSELVPATAHLF